MRARGLDTWSRQVIARVRKDLKGQRVPRVPRVLLGGMVHLVRLSWFTRRRFLLPLR